jgi:glycosyltransferase 2 family protein
MTKKILQFLLFLSIGVVILTLVYRSQNAAFQQQCVEDQIPAAQCSLTDKLLHDFSTVNVAWLLAVVAAFTVSNVFRALRWQMLLEPLGHRVRFSNSLLTILLGYFANLGFPRMGEVVRAGSLSRYERIPLERTMGTLVMDRLMDVLCLGAVVGLAFLLEGEALLRFFSENKKDGAGGSPWWAHPVVVAGLAVMAVAGAAAVFFWKKLAQTPLVQKVLGLLQGFWEGLRSVLRLRQPVLFLLYSAGIWLMFYLQCYFSMLAFAPTASLGAEAALMVFVFGTLGFVIPSPGGMGTFHALCIAGLALYKDRGVTEADAFSYANISFFTIQIFYNVAAGLLSLLLLPVLNRTAAGKAE